MVGSNGCRFTVAWASSRALSIRASIAASSVGVITPSARRRSAYARITLGLAWISAATRGWVNDGSSCSLCPYRR